MAKKYNKITEEDILKLFKTNKVVNRAMITKEYNCSVYSVRWIIDDLIDQKIIKHTSHGYKIY